MLYLKLLCFGASLFVDVVSFCNGNDMVEVNLLGDPMLENWVTGSRLLFLR